jgi:hypothetical protein
LDIGVGCRYQGCNIALDFKIEYIRAVKPLIESPYVSFDVWRPVQRNSATSNVLCDELCEVDAALEM